MSHVENFELRILGFSQTFDSGVCYCTKQVVSNYLSMKIISSLRFLYIFGRSDLLCATPQVPTALIQRVGGFISYGCMERCKAQISAQFPPRASHFQLFFHFSCIQFQFVTVPDCVHLCLYRTVR